MSESESTKGPGVHTLVVDIAININLLVIFGYFDG